MATPSLIPSGDFRTSYAADTTIFPTSASRNAAIVGALLICFAPLVFTEYWLSISIQIGIFAIAALGLNILVGFTGQISIGHAAFFLLGAFTSAYISNTLPIPVFFAIPLAGVITALVGLIFGLPAARLQGLYLSAEIMGINLTKYRTLSFGLAAFFAGIAGALYAHYQLVVSNEGFGIERSILFLAMIIIGGTGSVMGTLMGTAFVILLPESMEWISASLRGSAVDKALSLNTNISFLREISIGLIIIAFLMFEPDGLAHRWRQIKTYWKLYPFSH